MPMSVWASTETMPHILPGFLLNDAVISLPWQMICYLTVGLVTMIVVSLFTRPVAKEQLDSFYTCLRTPIGTDEPETEPFTLPPGTEPAPRQVWFDHPDFEIPKPTPVDIIGFFAGWAGVGLLIAVFYWILGG